MLMQGRVFGDPDAKEILIQIAGQQEEGFLQKDYERICKLAGRQDFCLITLPVTDWNNDLSPWEAPPVFGNEGFGGGAEKTFEELSEQVKTIRENFPDAKLYLGGYSLAGLSRCGPLRRRTLSTVWRPLLRPFGSRDSRIT